MDAELQKLETEVISHQLRGIMFHNDMFELACLMRMASFMRCQRRQAKEEYEIYLRTSQKFIEDNDEIISPAANLERVVITKEKINNTPMSRLEKMSIYEKALEVWYDWEKDTMELYQKMLSMQPGCTYWKRLIQSVNNELKMINRLQNANNY